jgi:hypothetical protein
MSNIIEFVNELTPANLAATGVAPLDGEMLLAVPLQFPVGAMPKIQVCNITISDRIANIFNGFPWRSWNNTKVRVWTNKAGSQQEIILPTGLYSDVTQIADAINSAITRSTDFYIEPALPALTIEANVITDKIVLSIDSRRLNSVQGHLEMTIDISKASSGTDMGITLGFSEGACVMTSFPLFKSSWTSDLIPKLDTQGIECDVHSSLISTRRRNNTFVRSLAIIAFAGKSSTSPSVWPSGGVISPSIVYEGSKQVVSCNFSIRTMDGYPMLFLSGGIHIVIAFNY